MWGARALRALRTLLPALAVRCPVAIAGGGGSLTVPNLDEPGLDPVSACNAEPERRNSMDPSPSKPAPEPTASPTDERDPRDTIMGSDSDTDWLPLVPGDDTIHDRHDPGWDYVLRGDDPRPSGGVGLEETEVEEGDPR